MTACFAVAAATYAPEDLRCIPGSRYSLQLHRHIRAIGDWSVATNPDNGFLQADFLAAVEAAPAEGATPFYAVFYDDDHRPVGVAVLQVQHYDAPASLRSELQVAASGWWQRAISWGRMQVARTASFHAFVCGNLLLSGEHGFYFHPHQVSRDEAIALMQKAMPVLRKGLEQLVVHRIALSFVKDIAADAPATVLVADGYTEFEVQPVMEMHLDPAWRTYEDYLAAMTAKYRTRARRARKKLGSVTCKRLYREHLQAYRSRMMELYSRVAESSGFNLVTLTDGYFLALEAELGDAFRCTGYFEGEELVGFTTTVLQHGRMEAHYLGFEPTLNASHQLYLNMLYDMIEQGIDRRAREINFSRTALEIKSSVGATPRDYKLYLKHANPILNALLPLALRILKPEEVWQPRHPFKSV